jgi:ferredoxin
MRQCLPGGGDDLVSANNPHRPKMKMAKLDPERCLGCGVCVEMCAQQDGIQLVQRESRVLTPLNTYPSHGGDGD